MHASRHLPSMHTKNEGTQYAPVPPLYISSGPMVEVNDCWLMAPWHVIFLSFASK